MPLSELLYRVAKGKLDSSHHNKDPSSSSAPPENDVAELVCENGQVLSSRVRKIEACNNLQQPQSPTGRARPEASGTGFKFGGKYGLMPPEVDLGQDDDVVPRLNYPIEDNLQLDYCSELSGVTVTGNSSHNNLASSYRGGIDRFVEMQYGERVDHERFYSAGDSVRSSAGPSHSKLSPASFPCFKSRFVSSSCRNVQLAPTAIHRPVSEDLNHILTSRGGFPAMKSQDQGFLNSSLFLRPLPFDKAKPDGISVRVVPTSMETVATSSPGSIPCTGNCSEFSFIDSCGGTTQSHPTKPSEQNPVSPEKRLAKETVPQEFPESAVPYDGCKISKLRVGSGAKRLDNGAKNVQPVNASSIGSGNTVGRASDDAVQSKRKHQDSEEYEGHSEDADEESIGAKRSSSVQGVTSAKRSRAAEVHNLSERRRRDRINEKMRALQELIPNCNKVDRASMLDEAIDYLKTLQQQIQFMSMRSGLYMPSMVLPPGMCQMQAAHMAQFSNMGVGMGMGFGFGMGMPDVNGGASGFSMLQAPSIPGAHFLRGPMPGPSPLNGFGLGIPGQGLPMPYPYLPISGGPVLNTTMGTPAHGLQGSSANQAVAPSLVSREAIPSIKSRVIPQNGASGSANSTSSKKESRTCPHVASSVNEAVICPPNVEALSLPCQCQETKECHHQSALVRSEHQTAGVADNQTS